jgi:uncharacterized repeat protein (TIGR02543 family)
MEVKAKAQTTSETERMITVDGNVRAVITSEISKRSDYPGSRVMNLEGQIVNIRFEDSKKKFKKEVSTTTDEKGNYRVDFLIKGEGELFVEVESNNDACIVRNLYSSDINDKNSGAYTYSESQKTSLQKKTYHINLSIKDVETLGAFVIARYVYGMFRHIEKKLNYTPPKVIIQWERGRTGEDSISCTKKYPNEYNGEDTEKIKGYININGFAMDEFNESVICHEYAHWVFLTMISEGNFAGGKHLIYGKAKSLELAYSEGLATYMGQAFLQTPHYLAVYPNGAEGMSAQIEGREGEAYEIRVDLENYAEVNLKLQNVINGVVVPTIPIGKKLDQYETVVAGCLWDLDDAENPKELWDRVSNSEDDIFNINKILIKNFKPKTDNESPLYDITLKQFYDKYMSVYAKNRKAKEIWYVFLNNYCQYDKEPPTFKKNIVRTPVQKSTSIGKNVAIEIGLEDEVGIDSVVLVLDKNKVRTITDWDPASEQIIELCELLPGKHEIAIKANDFAGNYVTKEAQEMAGDLPSKIIPQGYTYRTPYTMTYVTFTLPESTDMTNAATDTETSNAESTNTDTTDTTATEITDTNTVDSADTIETGDESDWFPADLPAHPFAEEFQMSQAGQQTGTLAAGASSDPFTFEVSNGTDYAVLSDDWLGDFSLELTDPAGNIYYAGQRYENMNVAEDGVQTVLNLGSQGAMIFHGMPGTWSYRILNHGEEASYDIGIYTQMAAPLVENSDELLELTSGTFMVSGTSMVQPGAMVQLQLTDSSGKLVEERQLPANGTWEASFTGIQDGDYNLRTVVVSADGVEGWDGNYGIAILSAAPIIHLSDDYEFFTYDGTVHLSGSVENGEEVSVTCNGTPVELYYPCSWETLGFYTDETPLQTGANEIVITAVGKTGLTAEKRLTLISKEKQEEKLPEIASVTYDGAEVGEIQNGTRIEIKLADPDVSQYRVQVLLKNRLYDLTPDGDSYYLVYQEKEFQNGNGYMLVYVDSKERDSIIKEYPVTFLGGTGIYAVSQPGDVETTEGKTVTLELEGFFSETPTSYETYDGTISGNVWSATFEEAGLYPVTIWAKKDDREATISFYVVVDGGEEAEEKTCEVTLYPTGGSVVPETITGTAGEPYGTLPTPVRYGYLFQGWYTQASGGERITETDCYKEETTALYAQWNSKQTTLVFEPEGGALKESERIVYFGQAYGTLPEPTKSGYLFNGWYTAKTGGEQVTAATKVTSEEPIHLYARWGTNQVTVTWDAMGGTVSKKTSTVTYGEPYGTMPVPTKKGYTFAGWYTMPEGGRRVVETDSVSVAGSHSLYAHWNPLSVTVHFHGNGGTITEERKLVSYGQTYGVLPNAEKSGCTFLGWYTEAYGGSQIKADDIVTALSPIMLYARWRGKVSTVSFDPRGGTMPAQTKEVAASELYGTLPVPVREGYTFDGWTLTPDGKDRIEEGTVVTADYPHTLYAQWISKGYQVVFSANGGSVSTKSKSVKNGDFYGSLPTPTYQDHAVFLGWFTEQEGGKQVLARDIVNLSENQTLYAHWKMNDYRVTFDPNGGTFSGPKSKIVTYGEVYGELPVPSLTHYVFQGWFTSINNETSITAASKVNLSQEITLYAQWKGQETTVTFEPEGGTVSKESKPLYYGGEYGTLPTPKKTGYDFTGWYTKPSGGTLVTDDTTCWNLTDSILYAHWKVKEPIITFSANGGEMLVDHEWVGSTKRVYSYGDNYGSLPVPVKEGYHFVGWYTSTTSSGTEITAGTKVEITTTDTLYAHWEGNTYQVMLRDNGPGTSSGTVKTVQVVFGESYGELPNAEKADYTFTGWYTEDGKKVSSSTKVTTAGNHSLYAHWTGASVSVTLMPNGGELSSSHYVVYYQGTYKNLPVPKRTGYDFTGWYTSESGGTLVTADTVVSRRDAHKLYAHWQKKTYVIQFDANGGTCSEDFRIVEHDEKYGTLPTTTRPGYTFLGWYTTNDAGGHQITAESSINMNFTAYAWWRGNVIELTFNPNGGTVSESAKRVTSGQNYGTLPTPIWSGHTFKGWYTKKDGGRKILSTMEADASYGRNLYAHWNDQSYTVTFRANGGTVDLESTSVTKGTSYSDFPTPVREGYRFTGWYTSTSSSGKKVTSLTATDILYAHWEGLETTVLFNGNGTSVSPSSKTVAYGSKYGTLPAPKRTNYTFQGWYLGTTKVTATSTVKLLSPTELEAHWKGVSSKVTYNANGGTCSTKTKTVYYGEEFGSMTTPSRTGYDFLGWFTTQSGGEQLTAASVVNWTSAKTIYAHWKETTPTIVFNANNGRLWEDGVKKVSVTKIVTYGHTYGTLPMPERDGYVFQGWFTSSTGGNQIEAGTTVSVASKQTLYAHWKGVESTVSFDANGGNCEESSRQVFYEEDYGTLPVPTRYGYAFLGWYTAKEGGKKLSATTEVPKATNHTVYALWENAKIKVKYDFNGGYIVVNNPETNTSYTISSSTKSLPYQGTYGGTTNMPLPSKKGNMFAGYYTEPEGGRRVTGEEQVTDGDAHTLYAHWIPKECLVIFDANSGNPVAKPYSVVYGTSYGTLPTPTREYYTFDGWYTTKTGKTEITSQDIVELTSTKTYYAHWTPNVYPIQLDAQGGSVDVNALQVAYEGNYDELPKPTKGEERFLGWYTAPNGGEKITENSILQTPAAACLYAHWAPVSTTLIFDGNGATASFTKKTVTLGSYYSTLPSVSRKGYYFLGWYTAETGGTLVTEQSRVVALDKQTLYAHWIAVEELQAQ